MIRYPIKVCGITRKEDAFALADMGVGALGFIFYSKSPRCADFSKLKKWVNQLPSELLKVGVVVDLEIHEINQIYHDLNLDVIQLHGDQDLHFCHALNLPYWKVIRVAVQSDLSFEEDQLANAILLDTKSPEGYGGIGKSFNWELLNSKTWSKPTILAGGLSLENVELALNIANIDYWDFNSGLECNPGEKDLLKAETLMQIVHQWCARTGRFGGFK